MKDVTLAAVSIRSRPAKPKENIENHIPWLARAKEAGATLCCFPEMSVTGFSLHAPTFYGASEYLDKSESICRMVELAREYDLRIGFGLATREKRDIVRNTYVFVSSEGYMGHYCKTHIPIMEYPILAPENEFSVVDLGDARVGVNICFDNWFCETGRMSYLNGAEVIIAPFWMGGGKNEEDSYAGWKHLAVTNFPAVAWQNGVFHVSINSCGGIHEDGIDYDGPPVIFIFNPQGELEVDTDPSAQGERMVVHTLEAAKLDRRRGEPLFHPKYRRPEIYGEIAHS